MHVVLGLEVNLKGKGAKVMGEERAEQVNKTSEKIVGRKR